MNRNVQEKIVLKVREISKQNAALVRQAFRKEKQKEIQILYNKHQVNIIYPFKFQSIFNWKNK